MTDNDIYLTDSNSKWIFHNFDLDDINDLLRILRIPNHTGFEMYGVDVLLERTDILSTSKPRTLEIVIPVFAFPELLNQIHLENIQYIPDRLSHDIIQILLERCGSSCDCFGVTVFVKTECGDLTLLIVNVNAIDEPIYCGLSSRKVFDVQYMHRNIKNVFT